PFLATRQPGVIGRELGYLADLDAGTPPPPPGQVRVDHDLTHVGDRVIGADPPPPAQRLRQRLLDEVLGFLETASPHMPEPQHRRKRTGSELLEVTAAKIGSGQRPSSLHSLGLASIANCCTPAYSSPSFLDRRPSRASDGRVNGRRSRSRAT